MNHLTEIQLNEYLDQMLDESARQNVEAHLSGCEQCRMQLNEMEVLFSTLENLPDMPLTRDLTPGILARLPKAEKISALWRQPAFVMQSLLTIILLSASMPMLRALNQKISVWCSEIILPTIQFPSWPQMIAQLTPLLTWKPQLTFTLPELSFMLPTMPTLPTLPFSPDTNIVLMLVISAGMLWMVGNISLLRSRPEVRE